VIRAEFGAAQSALAGVVASSGLVKLFILGAFDAMYLTFSVDHLANAESRLNGPIQVCLASTRDRVGSYSTNFKETTLCLGDQLSVIAFFAVT